MKKTFSLHAPGVADARVVESIKHEVRRYVKRERGKRLPEGFDVWEFSCKVGADPSSAEPKELREVTSAIDTVAATGSANVFIEVVARAAHRAALASPTLGGTPTPEASDEP